MLFNRNRLCSTANAGLSTRFVIAISYCARYGARVFKSAKVCWPQGLALNGKSVRVPRNPDAAPATVIDIDPRIAIRSFATVLLHGKASAMYIKSPETGLSGFDWCCGGQHRQALPAVCACSCPPQKSSDLLRIYLSEIVPPCPGCSYGAEHQPRSYRQQRL